MWDGDTTARHFLKLLDPTMLEMARCPEKLHHKIQLYVALAGVTAWLHMYELNMKLI